ncbi:phenylacetate--CoA ligase family protein [Dongia sp.]|uniref:phenylacetate--CoA ligase family protein n=1 Tax=Dongia sp. TaxID=1977262 RepID=UPI003751A9FC
MTEQRSGFIFRPEVETRAPAEQNARDRAAYRRQIAYLVEHSPFHRAKLRAAGFAGADAAGDLERITQLPFTEKDEIRASQAASPPFGDHCAAAPDQIVRVYSTSGTTGEPCYMPLTAKDLAMWIEISSRSYTATGLRRGLRMVSTYNAGPFVAGAAIDAFGNIGACHIPVGTGNTERLAKALQLIRPEALVCTPSYAQYLGEWLRGRGIDPAGLGLKRISVAGEPGGGEPAFRAAIEATFGAKVCEAMGIGDVAISLWGECEHQQGMHFCGGDFVHVELVDPVSGEALALEEGAEGELVYTALQREAAPPLRFRSRDHVVIWTAPCACGRRTLRTRCIGRTDDMLIVRGVNLFPTAIRDVVAGFRPAVSGALLIKPTAAGTRQEPPVPVDVELAEGGVAQADLAERIEAAIRAKLVVTTRVNLVPFASLPRSEYKTKLVKPNLDKH